MTQSETQERLRPCPFCGSAPETGITGAPECDNWRYVKCSNDYCPVRFCLFGVKIWNTRAPVDSQGAGIRDHYFVPTLIRDSCAKCGKGADRHPGHDQVATQMRDACVEKVRAAIDDLSRTSIAAEQNAREINVLIALREALSSLTLDQVKQKER